jgi:hypothetical protein
MNQLFTIIEIRLNLSHTLDSNFGKLAHQPHGTIAPYSFHVFKFDPSDGSMTLLNVAGDTRDVVNPAFSRILDSMPCVHAPKMSKKMEK